MTAAGTPESADDVSQAEAALRQLGVDPHEIEHGSAATL
jgi:hypothetical protein